MNKMSAGKKVSLRVGGIIFGIGLLLLPFTLFVTFWLSSAQAVNKQLERSTAYDVASEALAAQMIRYASAEASTAALPQDVIERAVKSVITPELLQQKTETYIVANYDWLNNERDEPLLEINLANERELLTAAFAREAEQTIERKPACDVTQMNLYQAQLQTDPLSVPCRLTGVDPGQVQSIVGQKAEELMQSSTQNDGSGQADMVSMLPSGGAQQWEFLERLIRLIYWGMKHGFMMIISVLLLAGVMTFLAAGTVTRWLMWARAVFASTAITLAFFTLWLVLATQTSIFPMVFVPTVAQTVVAVLAVPLIVVLALTAAAYLVAMVFGILARKKEVRNYEQAAHSAGASSGSSGQSY